MDKVGKEDNTLDHYLGLPYTVEVRRDEDGWFAKVFELPGCMTWADTFEELGSMIEDAKRGWIEDAMEHGDPVPEPRRIQRQSRASDAKEPPPRPRPKGEGRGSFFESDNGCEFGAFGRRMKRRSELHPP